MEAQAIEKVAKEVGRLDLSDHILSWDKRQGGFPHDSEMKDAEGKPLAEPPRLCQHVKAHGRLQMRADGAALMCTATKPSHCTYVEPVSR